MTWRRSGRPLIGTGGTVTGVFTLTTIHQAMITAWRARHGCIRQMIEIAEQTDAAATHGRESSTSPS